MKKILLISGSLRRQSFNTQMAHEAAKLLEGRARVKLLDFSALPYMNQDCEQPVPEVVARVRTEVQSADGLWFFTPEYNYSYPGVLKNMLDWMSRPVKPGETATAIAGKKATICAAAGRSAGAGARAKLSELLQAIKVDLMAEPQLGVVLDREAFTSDVLSLTDEQRAELAEQADAFLSYLGEH